MISRDDCLLFVKEAWRDNDFTGGVITERVWCSTTNRYALRIERVTYASTCDFSDGWYCIALKEDSSALITETVTDYWGKNTKLPLCFFFTDPVTAREWVNSDD